MSKHTPALVDIARGLSVIQRWNGMTIVPWDVLRHSILVGAVLPGDATVYTRLHALLHDAAEMYTGDIPRPYKVPEQVEHENSILADIYAGIGLNYPTLGSKARVLYADNIAALAESEVLVPLSKRRDVRNADSMQDAYNPESIEAASELIWAMRDMNRKESIDLWLESVRRLLDEYHGVDHGVGD